MEFTFIKLVIALRLEEDIADPLALFGLRSDFEPAFRDAVACTLPACTGCPSVADCPYQQNFARALSCDPAALRRFQKPSLPFVFDIPRLPLPPNRGVTVELGLTLLGTASRHVPVYLAALRNLLRGNGLHGRGALRPVRVESIGDSGTRQCLQEGDGELFLKETGFLSFQGLQQAALATPQTLALNFDTPLRLVHEGRPLRQLSFSSLARPLMRRTSSLAYYYGGLELDYDFRWLAREAELVDSMTTGLRWVDWGGEVPGSRASGLVGRAVFQGDLADFQPFLLFGEHVHLGKGASYGLGAYRIEKIA
ncbi:MAG TPA: CRISPR system precrRNA processing endoribonuclease RAMP protein Cas6 [Geobacteraceae bacterium]